MTDQPPVPPPGSYPPPPPPPSGYPPPPQGGYAPPPPPQGGYAPPPPPQGGYAPPPPVAVYPQTPGQPLGALPTEAYTPWIRRVGAFIIDYLPMAIIGGIGQGIAIGTGDNQCVTDTSGSSYNAVCTSSPSAVGLIIELAAAIVVLAYWIWNYGYRQGTTGSSIGKSVLKFKVVSEKTGQPIGFGLSVVRQIAHFVDAIICYIGYLFPLWDAKRQTLADKIMTTVCLPTT